MRRLPRPIAALAVLPLLFLLLAGCDSVEEPQRQLTPDFELPDLEGQLFKLSQQQGKVVLLQFFRTTCSACQSEVPDLNLLNAEYAAQGLVLVGVAYDGVDTSATRQFVETFSPNYRILRDDGRVTLHYGVDQFPNGFLIDREGWIAAQLVGVHTKEELETLIKPLLAASAD